MQLIIFKKVSDMNLLRINDVVKKTSIGKSTIWAWVKDEKFPKPIKLSERISVWKESNIDAWIERKISAKNSPT